MFFLDLILNMISTTMIFMFVYTFVNFFQLDKKNQVVQSVQQMLAGFFIPILTMLRKLLPASRIDYSGMAFVVILWISYRLIWILR